MSQYPSKAAQRARNAALNGDPDAAREYRDITLRERNDNGAVGMDRRRSKFRRLRNRAILSVLALCSILATPLPAATITGDTESITGVAVRTNLTFRPRSSPVLLSGVLVLTDPITITNEANGTFSIELRPGDYELQVGASTRNRILFTVPSTNGSYTINSLVTTGAQYPYEFLRNTNLNDIANAADAVWATPFAQGDVIWWNTNSARWTNSPIASVPGYSSGGGGGGTNPTNLPGTGMLITTNNANSHTFTADTNTLATRAWVAAADTNELRVINVKSDFGALGDGVTDDTLAISNALAFAGQDFPISETSMRTATNRTRNAIFFPAGTYNVTSRILVSNDHAHIFGAGRGRTIIKATAGNSVFVTTNAPRYLTLRDFSVVGSSVTPTAGSVGIDLVGTDTNYFASPAPYIGFLTVDNVDVNYFDIGLRGQKLQDVRLYLNAYHNNVGVLLSNTIHGVWLDGSSRFNNRENYILHELRACRIWARDSDLSDADTATNLFKITGSVQYTTIQGRTEIHKPGVIAFNFQGGTINRLHLDNFQIHSFDDAEGWSLYFTDHYTSNQAYLMVSGGSLEVTNAALSGAQVRIPHGYNVKLFSYGVQSPTVAAFTNGSYYTNFRAGAEIEYSESGRRQAPNAAANQNLAHQPWFNYRGTNTEQYFVPMYDRQGVLTNVNLSEPWFQIRDDEIPTRDDSVLWSGLTHSFSGIITNRLNLNVTNTGAAGVQGILRITSEGVGGTAGHQIVLADNSALNTTKAGRIGIINYNPALNPLSAMIASHSSANAGTLLFGGGTSLGTPFREIEWYGGNSGTNGAGNLLMKQYTDGGLAIGSAATPPTDPGDGNLGVVGKITIGTAGTATNDAARLFDLQTTSNALASTITTVSNQITNAIVLQGANVTVTDGVTNGVRFFVVNGPSGSGGTAPTNNAGTGVAIITNNTFDHTFSVNTNTIATRAYVDARDTIVSNALDAAKLNTSGGNADAVFSIHSLSFNSGDGTVILGGGDILSVENSGGIHFSGDITTTYTGIFPFGTGFIVSDQVNTYLRFDAGRFTFTNLAPRSAVLPTNSTDLVRLQDLTNATYNPKRETLVLFASGATNATTTGTNFMMVIPYNCSIEVANVMAAVNRHIPPTGAQMRFRLQTNGVSIMSTDLHIDANETTSLTAATNFTFSTTNLLRGSFLELNVIEVGSTVAGAGAHVWVPVRETP